jgi:IclR family acetate operon transcriptional repressor
VFAPVQDERPSGGGVRSVLTALRVLEEVATRQPIGVSDLARAMDMSKSSVQRVVTTLAEAGWVRTTGAEPTRWQTSYRALTVGMAGVTMSGLEEVAHSEMRQIRDATQESVHLGVPEGADLVIVSRLDGTLPIRTYLQLGTRAPLQSSAGGRAILAALPDEEIAEILARGTTRWTDRTLVERDAILAEIERTRQRGYSLNAGEWRHGIGAVGAVVLDRERRPRAGLSTSMPLNRWEQADIPAIAGLLREAAGRIGQLSGI